MTDSFVRVEKAGKFTDPVATSLLMYGGPRVDRNMNIKSVSNGQVVSVKEIKIGNVISIF